jgi:hypothetical protein
MRNILASLVVAVLVIGSAQFVSAAMIEDGTANSVMYMCGCGPDCACGMMSDTPGNCKCGKEMAGVHMLKVEGATGVFCTCGADCTCKIDPDDASKCGCGKAVRKADITGKYVCGCGPECDCNSISTKPGNCHCGKPLVKVE